MGPRIQRCPNVYLNHHSFADASNLYGNYSGARTVFSPVADFLALRRQEQQQWRRQQRRQRRRQERENPCNRPCPQQVFLSSAAYTRMDLLPRIAKSSIELLKFIVVNATPQSTSMQLARWPHCGGELKVVKHNLRPASSAKVSRCG